jgi:glycosyltransferase involved in cell wall biosynthesis
MISILLAVYNGEQFIQEAVQSVLFQTYRDIELLVGFNGTSDSSREILAAFNDPRIKIFDYGIDKGKAKTLNKLLNEASGDWIAVQDDDDIWLPIKLEEQAVFTLNYDVIGTRCKYIDSSGSIIGQPDISFIPEEIIEKTKGGDNQVINSSALIRRSALVAMKGWSEEEDGVEDFDLWLRMMGKNYKFLNLPGFLVLHRLHPNSNYNGKGQDVKKIIKKYR